MGKDGEVVMLYPEESAQHDRNKHLPFWWKIKDIIRKAYYSFVKKSDTLSSWHRT